MGAAIGGLGLVLLVALGGLTWIGWTNTPTAAAPAARREVVTRELVIPEPPDAALPPPTGAPREVRTEHEGAGHGGAGHARAAVTSRPTESAGSTAVLPDAAASEPTTSADPGAEPAPSPAPSPTRPPATSTPGSASSTRVGELCEIASRCCERIGAPYEACRDRMAEESEATCRQIIRGYRSAFEQQGREPGPCREP